MLLNNQLLHSKSYISEFFKNLINNKYIELISKIKLTDKNETNYFKGLFTLEC